MKRFKDILRHLMACGKIRQTWTPIRWGQKLNNLQRETQRKLCRFGTMCKSEDRAMPGSDQRQASNNEHLYLFKTDLWLEMRLGWRSFLMHPCTIWRHLNIFWKILRLSEKIDKHAPLSDRSRNCSFWKREYKGNWVCFESCAKVRFRTCTDRVNKSEHFDTHF